MLNFKPTLLLSSFILIKSLLFTKCFIPNGRSLRGSCPLEYYCVHRSVEVLGVQNTYWVSRLCWFPHAHIPGQDTLVSYLFHLSTSPVKDFWVSALGDHQKDMKAPVARDTAQPPWGHYKVRTKGWLFQGSPWYQLNHDTLSIWRLIFRRKIIRSTSRSCQRKTLRKEFG